MYDISFLLTFNLEYLQSISLVYRTHGASLAVGTLFDFRILHISLFERKRISYEISFVHETEEYLSRVPRSVPSSI